MTDAEEARPQLLRSDPLAESGYLSFRRDLIRFPDGHEATRAIVGHPGAVALVVVDDEGRWLLVRQYRHPARQTLLEIPAGTREPSESPEVTAAREVREETGFAAAHLERLGGMWMVPGWGEEYIDFFLATDLQPSPLPQDDDEYLSEPILLTLDEVYAAVDSGEIQDAKTIAALTLYERSETKRRRSDSEDAP
ncbi:MAG: NUDIX hydrolase [Chloroflexi bacterium]|nr:NUDIX hydrolase [Chloroflexota bacterium]MQC17149.1 NUDIX hydrolase [Chloroflexota bacterium]